ncbi:hypothetical protein LJ739_01430 [Aestuariibacter halophilus]|uniref:Uncharacterized protein n=1 Tax=Fluctibacter halophilus TaxID=226011 RepID=A0ABS8G335_9ALTE|nr:hypothetical protein [Aestuariibacter halophilus]MCC2614899.1 hypothetical protein [Aestuariibacter halophilus]
MTYSDDLFLSLFEHKTLPPKHFDHHGHLRLAWIYLSTFTLAEAVDRITRTIPAYAAHWGDPDKFHHTLTEAIVRIMALRKQQHPTDSFDDFLARNPDLITGLRGVISQYYSDTRLNSSTARQQFVSPDRKALITIQQGQEVLRS